MAFILFRGDTTSSARRWMPSTPAVLPPMPADLPRNRLGLAQWLVDPDNPLTARVTVNRFWQEVFGTGLVRTPATSASQGEAAVAPRAARLAGRRVPRVGLGREEVLQADGHCRPPTASRPSTTPEKLEKDPENRCCRAARGSAWTPRWSATTRWPPAACWSEDRRPERQAVPARRRLGSGGDDRQQHPRLQARHGRRALSPQHVHVLEAQPRRRPSMDIFNAPTREACTVRRERTNTPLQALVTLNDPQFVEAARHLAERALKEAAPTPDERLDFIASRLLARPFDAEGARRSSRHAYRELPAYYEAQPDDAKKLIAVGESKPDPTPRRRGRWPPGRCWPTS